MKKVGVLCYYKFPEGMAPTTRIIAYGKGLVRNNVDTEVVIIRPRQIPSDYPDEGLVEGVRYVYPYSRKNNVNRIRNLFIEKPRSVIKTIKYIKKSNKEKKYDCFFISFDEVALMTLYIAAIRLLRIPLLFIGDEYPKPIREKLHSDIPYWKKNAYRILHHPLCGRILMTEALKNYYNRNASMKPTHILPTIVDTNRFTHVKEEINYSGNPYLCYMGNMELSKDNVDNIVRAFYILKHNSHYKRLELHLYGKPSPNDRIVLDSLIKELGLNDSVFLKGRVNYSVVPTILKQATILVTSQPKTKRAEGGFPTKLGEYLLSNKPAIVTNVGEISNYVKDGYNAYMVEPNNPDEYAKKMDYILSHPKESKEVANRGRAYIMDNYSCEKVSLNLIVFLDNLLSN